MFHQGQYMPGDMSFVSFSTVRLSNLFCLVFSYLLLRNVSELFEGSYCDEQYWWHEIILNKWEGSQTKTKRFTSKECSEEATAVSVFGLYLKQFLCACRWSRWVSCLPLWSLCWITTDRPRKSWRSFLANWKKGQCRDYLWKMACLLYVEAISSGLWRGIIQQHHILFYPSDYKEWM